MTQPLLHILFRACDLVNAVNKNPRPFQLDKATLIKVCFLSLYESAQHVPHRFYVVGDKLSSDMLSFFSAYNVELSNGEYGNDASIRETLQRTDAFPANDWVYFCEDDYLHVPHAMEYIYDCILTKDTMLGRERRLYNWASFLDLRAKDFIIHPADYPDRYKSKYRRFSLITHTEKCHWRQITDTTFTFLMQVATVRKRRALLERASHRANDRLLSKRLYGKYMFGSKALCMSPIPGLATHMHMDTMSPLVDWSTHVEHYLGKLNGKPTSTEHNPQGA